MNKLVERYKACGRCIHDGDDDNICESYCHLCLRNPTDNRIDWFEARKEETVYEETL